MASEYGTRWQLRECGNRVWPCTMSPVLDWNKEGRQEERQGPCGAVERIWRWCEHFRLSTWAPSWPNYVALGKPFPPRALVFPSIKWEDRTKLSWRRDWNTLICGPNPAHYLLSSIKFYWNNPCSYLYILSVAAFMLPWAESNSCQV